MSGFAVGHGAANSDLVSNFGTLLKVFAEVYTRDFRGYTAKRSTIFKGGIGLGIPGFLMGHASRQINMNHALRGTLFGLIKLLGTMCLYFKKVGKGKAKPPDKSNM
jgi:hypothetical protein